MSKARLCKRLLVLGLVLIAATLTAVIGYIVYREGVFTCDYMSIGNLSMVSRGWSGGSSSYPPHPLKYGVNSVKRRLQAYMYRVGPESNSYGFSLIFWPRVRI